MKEREKERKREREKERKRERKKRKREREKTKKNQFRSTCALCDGHCRRLQAFQKTRLAGPVT